jgi:diguanylate cyclase
VAAARQDELTDPVTGLANRRMLDIILGTRMGELNRLGLPFGLLMVDVDDFTPFSDRYGPEAGDAALRVVAETLSGAVRGDETVARWGGGEFAVVATRVDEAELTRLAERILALVRATRIDTGGEAVPVQVSIGGRLARAGEPLLVLFGRADQALLKAKTTGHDRFVLADVAPLAG